MAGLALDAHEPMFCEPPKGIANPSGTVLSRRVQIHELGPRPCWEGGGVRLCNRDEQHRQVELEPDVPTLAANQHLSQRRPLAGCATSNEAHANGGIAT